MKIALIITGLGMGGAERQVCDLANQYAMGGHDVLLLSLTGKATISPSSKKIKLLEIGMKKTFSSFLIAYWRAHCIIQKFEPDVVHSHMVHANLFTRLLRILTPMPRLICTAHSTNEGGRLRMLGYKLTDRLASTSTNVSNEAVATYIAKGATKPGRMVVMHNGIDTQHFIFSSAARNLKRAEINISDGTPLLLAVGRLCEQKDYPNLLHAFSKVVKNSSRAKLVIIGDGPLKKHLQALAYRFDIADDIHFLGERHDVAEWMSAADIFVLSSALEGFGLVVAEAMACERVVVATDCGGVKEVMGPYGMLVSPQNSEQLAESINKALTLPPDEKEKIGKEARQQVKRHYSLPSIAQSWLELYRRQ